MASLPMNTQEGGWSMQKQLGISVRPIRKVASPSSAISSSTTDVQGLLSNIAPTIQILLELSNDGLPTTATGP